MYKMIISMCVVWCGVALYFAYMAYMRSEYDIAIGLGICAVMMVTQAIDMRGRA